MLVVPISGKIGWKNPPLTTISLIVLNCLIYFVFQHNDQLHYMEAEMYYMNSGLWKQELKAYFSYGGTPGKIDPDKLSEDEQFQFYQDMQSNSAFQKKLTADQIITPKNPDYPEWKKRRIQYEAMLDKVVFVSYGFNPSEGKLTRAFTYMFLHGGFGHLFGNMVFLWLVGCLLEAGVGRYFPLFTYVATGLLAVLLYWLVYMDRTISLVGASGSIAGFMGAFTVLYGFQRIKIFYSLGFYFNYIKFPAIALLPIWLGNEVFQLFFGGVSNVAYVAHIGGIVSGAGIAFGYRYLFKVDPTAIEDAEPEDRISPLLEKALEAVGRLDVPEARRLLHEVLEKDPQNMDAMTHLFNVEKLKPDHSAFHQAAARLIKQSCLERSTQEQAHALYLEYTKLTSAPKLSPELYARLGGVFSGLGHLEDAERILRMLVKKRPATTGLAKGALLLAEAFRKSGKPSMQSDWLNLVIQTFPDSAEARIAQNSLKSEAPA